MTLIAIPDIHGDFEQFNALLGHARRDFADAKIVLMGDFMDRGPRSAEVIRLVRRLTEEGHVALAGNHEDLFLGFLARDIARGFDFGIAGGGETIASFAEESGYEFRSPEELRDYLDETGLAGWLEALPHIHRDEGVNFTHAPVPAGRWQAIEPDRKLCMWGVPKSKDRADLAAALGSPEGTFAACGHVIMRFGADGVRRPEMFDHGVYLDCGCGSKEDGRLVACVFDDGKPVEYLTAAGREALS